MRASTGLALCGGLFASGLLAACGSSCPGSGELAARIEGLASGEHLALGECVITEAVSVPAGADVEGGTFELPAGASITLAPAPDGAPTTTLRGARVRGEGRGAGVSVRVVGPGTARIAGVVLELERGIGIGIAGARVVLEGVEIVGNVDPERVIELPTGPSDALATYGIAVLEGADVTIASSPTTASSVQRMATAGVICVGATLAVTGMTLSENRGLGLQAFDCAVTLTEVDVHDTLAAPGMPGIGVVAAMGTELTSVGLALHDAPGYGILVDASRATLDAPRIERMTQAGAWAGEGATLTITGGALDGNAGAAIAAVGAAGLEVRETRIAGTREAPIPSPGGGGADTMGDAIHVAQAAGVPCTVTLVGLTLVDNDRLGLVLDGALEPLTLTIERTRVETSGTQLGAIAQNVAALPPGWDADIARVGSAATLDGTAGPLPVSAGAGLRTILMPPTIEL